MKFVVMADLHLKMWNDNEILSDGTPRKLQEIINTVIQACEYCKKNDIKYIFIAGDINDTKDNFSVRSFVLLRKVIQKYNDLNWVILHGNHDLASNVLSEIKYSAIELFDSIDNCKLILEPEILEFEDDIEILCMPYCSDISSRIKEFEQKLSAGKKKILIGHFGLDEAVLSSGVSVRSEVKASDLGSFDLVILGHYHKPQEVTKNILYVGSPIQIRRDEVNEVKRFICVDTNNIEEIRSINTEGYRRFLEISVNTEEDLEKVKEIAKDSNINMKYVIVKLNMKVTKDQMMLLENCQLIDMTDIDINNRGISLSMSLDDQLKKYLQYKEIHEEDWDFYLQTAKEALESV